MISITTDYAAVSRGNPRPYLRRIAEAGFTHIHWCHQWDSDFCYDSSEINAISRWLKAYGLQLLDLHGSMGPEKNWASHRPHERAAGVALVRNRLEMTAHLGGDAVVMHIPSGPPSGALRRSLDALQPVVRSTGVRIAIENGQFPSIITLLSEYPPDFLGHCYDSGHANMTNGGGIGGLDQIKDRLLVVHLHDNDGQRDQHKLPFSGTVNWPSLAKTLAASAYKKPLSTEANMGCHPGMTETDFLSEALSSMEELDAMGRKPNLVV
ncbi:hypothetical protein CVU37_01135 [candidate division BRC1 bacterium HGW-BRC1-1]|jgi:sugar phosphate isomerase/epimerase|nr:MAG: hypothetical protein CVU37_01135 [candidate division BRC1 bacterium HGW-BRC1-1]